MSFQKWLSSPVMDMDDSNDKEFTHRDYIVDFIDGLSHVIHSSGYNIEDEKQFKNEIATFKYRLSREKL